MLIEDITISQKDSRTVRLSWTGTEGKNAWIFVNGVAQAEDEEFADPVRTFDIDVKDVTKTFCVEIHEAIAESDIEPINTAPELNPILHFHAAANAVKYNIYHHKAGEVDALLRQIPHDDNVPIYSVQFYDDFDGQDGVWHFFHVEAVDAYGRESTTDEWMFFVYDMPPAPESIALSKDGSTFTVALTM